MTTCAKVHKVHNMHADGRRVDRHARALAHRLRGEVANLDLELLGSQIFRVCNRVRNEPLVPVGQPSGHGLNQPTDPVRGKLHWLRKCAFPDHALDRPPGQDKCLLHFTVADILG